MEDTDADLSGCSDADDNNEEDDSASPAPQPRSNARRPPNDTEGPGPEAAAEAEPAAAPPSPPPSSKDPSPSTNDRNVRKAVRFLSSPSVVPLGGDVKVNFLRERGMTDVEIGRAVAAAARWRDREQRKQRHRGRGRRGGRDGRRRRANSSSSSSSGSTRRTTTRRRRRGSSEDSEDSIWNEKEDSAISSPGGDWDDDSAEEEEEEGEEGAMAELSGRRRKGRRQQHQLDQQPMTSDDPLQPQQLQHQYHQLQHQYAQPPPSAVVAALPLAVGGLLGASAAAFLRWIDGGEFGPGPGFGLGFGGGSGGSGGNRSNGSQSDQPRDRRAFPAGDRGQADDGTDNSAEKGGGAEKAERDPDRDLLQVDGTHDETRESSIYDYLDEYLGDEDGRQQQHQHHHQPEEQQEKYYEEEEDYYEGEEDYYEGDDGAMEEYYEEELGQQHEEEEEEPTASDQQQQLSRQIQDLTATVQRFAEAQERTVRQKTHEDGRDMTDSAMNLLRGSSSSAAAAANRQTNNEPIAVPNVALAVMLTEMKCEVQSAREAMDSAAAAATGDRRGSSAEAVRRATNKVDAVSASLLRLQKLLLGDHRTIGGGGGGGGGDEDELNLPVARNVASMYETPSRMFSTGELSPVRGCGMDGDGAGTTIDVTFSDDGGLGGGGGGGNGNGSGSANVSFEFEPTIIKTEEKKQDDCDCDYEYDEHNAEATEYPTVGKEALARAIGLLSDPKVNGEEVIVKSCAQLLYLYVTNLSSNASVKRYRKIYTTNANFRNNVRGCRGGVEVLQSLGFVDKGSFMEWNGNMEDEEAGLVLFNEAAARLSVLKVMGNRAELTDSSEEMESFAPMNNMATPRYRSATPPPPGAPPRPAITSSTSTGSAASISNNPQLLASPSGFVTPRMRGDGNDRFLSSPGANSVSSANLLCSPPVIDKHPSDQDGAAAVFGSGQDNDQGLGFPSAPSHSSVTSSAAAAAAEIFRSNKILPPRAPANASKDGESRNATSDYESIFGLHGSAFKRASSNQSCQSEPALLESGSNVKLKLRRSVASEDDAEFAARRNSEPSVGAATEVARTAPRSDSQDKESAMYFNLADMVGRGTESARPDTPGTPGSDRSNVSPSTLDYTLSPLNTSLLSVRTDATDA